MKVLIIAYDLEMTSGWGRHAMMVAREYDKRGIEYHVIGEIGRSAAQPRETKLLLASSSLPSIVRNMWRVWRAANGEYDIVHAFDVWPYGLYGYAAVFRTNAKLFLNGVGTYSVGPLHSWWKRLMLSFVFARTLKIFSVSAYTMREMLATVPSLKGKFLLTYLGTTDLPPASPGDLDRARSLFRITGSPVILTVGAIKDRKGQLDTLKAIGILKERYPDILYVIVGSSVNTEYVELVRSYARANNLEPNLRILDSIKHDRELAPLYELSDVFAMNSTNDATTYHFEGFGLVFLEAYQFGKPCVGSRNCGIEDVIDEGKTGYLCSQNNPADIANKITLILEKGPTSFAQAALEMRKRFTWNAVAEIYIRAYSARKED
jgi:glycosyltransferase involved in cell wall biosynthesis